MVSGGVSGEVKGRTLVLTFGNGPTNALDAAVRSSLLLALRQADCDAIVLASVGTSFSSALPLDPDQAKPALVELCTAVAGAGVPVVAAVQGLAMGAGAELVLAATARIAGPQARIALPEVALGLCPEAGTTRRLPDLIGTAAALRLLLTGRAVAADEALALGLVDVVTQAPLLDQAVALAARLADAGPPARRPEPAADRQAAIAAARRAHPRALPAVGRIIHCVEAGFLLPPDAAQAFETVAREDLEQTQEADGLRAAARAERRAVAVPPSVARASFVRLDRIALAGEAPGLSLLARAATARGIGVLWLHPAPQTLTSEVRASLGAGLRLVDDAAALSEVSLQICDTLADAMVLRRFAPDAAILILGGAEGEIGLSLAPSGRSAELSVLAEESPAAIAVALATLRRIGLPPLLVGKRPVLGSRMAAAGRSALAHLGLRGVPHRQLAASLAAFGAPLPAGLESAEAGPDAEPWDLPAPQVQARWLAALANEGLRLLDQGIARRPCDIDHALVAGYGFPRWQGGPMYQAERRGLLVLRHDLRIWSQESPIWSPAPLLDRLIQDDLRLSALNV